MQSPRDKNLEKKWRRCLKCGRKLWTDCCHRLCSKCTEENQSKYEPRVFHIAEDDFDDPDAAARSLYSEDELGMLELVDMLDGA